jgi:hypothetical protein
MFQHRCADVAGVLRLAHLGELERIAEEHDVLGGHHQGDRVRQRHLSGFIYEEVVESLVHVLGRERPRGAGD